MNKEQFVNKYFTVLYDDREELTSDLNALIASEIERVMPSGKEIIFYAKEDKKGMTKGFLNNLLVDGKIMGANWFKSEIIKRLKEG